MIEHVAISKLKPNPDNPRTITDEQFDKLVKSIKDFPEMLEKRPFVVDENMVILGGNQRLRACKKLKKKQVPIISAIGWTEEQKREFVVKDNLSFGAWNWGDLSNNWNTDKLNDWGMDAGGFEVSDEDDLGTDFDLPAGEKSPFQQQTYTLADEQAVVIKNAIADIKKTEEFKYVETFGNENGNANALYLIVTEWAAQKK